MYINTTHIVTYVMILLLVHKFVIQTCTFNFHTVATYVFECHLFIPLKRERQRNLSLELFHYPFHPLILGSLHGDVIHILHYIHTYTHHISRNIGNN